MNSLTKLLGASAWAQGLTTEQLRRVESETVLRDCPAGGYACRKGEPVEHWIGVAEGLLKLSIASPEGKMATLTGVPAGGWFGEGSLLKTERRHYDAVALRDSCVALMPRATFYHLLDTSIGFNRFLLHQLNERLAQFIAMLEYERLLDPDARIARCLAWLFNPFLYPGVIHIRPLVSPAFPTGRTRLSCCTLHWPACRRTSCRWSCEPSYHSRPSDLQRRRFNDTNDPKIDRDSRTIRVRVPGARRHPGGSRTLCR